MARAVSLLAWQVVILRVSPLLVKLGFARLVALRLGRAGPLGLSLGQFPLGLSLGSSIGFEQRVLGQGGALLGWVGGDIKGSPLLVILGHVGGTELG